MTDDQRGGKKKYTGTYTDNLQFTWTWTCPKLETQSAKVNQTSDAVLPPYTEKRQEVIEYAIIIIFVVSSFWLIGLPIYIVAGNGIQIYYLIALFTGID